MSLTEIVDAVTALAWPVLVAVVLWLLLPTIKEIIGKRGFSVKVGGIEIGVQELSEQLARGDDDLRDQILALKRRLDALDGQSPPDGPAVRGRRALDGEPSAPPMPMPMPMPAPARSQPPAVPELESAPAPAPPPTAAPATRRPAVSPPPVAAQLRHVLWVDDHPENNAFEVHALEERGVTVQLVRSTDDALRAIRTARLPFDAIISDMGRREDGRERRHAGIELIERLRGEDVTTPVVVYASAGAVAREGDRVRRLGAAATASATELLELLGVRGGS